MDLKIFFNTVKEEIFKDIEDYNSFFNNIYVNHEKFPDWKNADIALIGLIENKGTEKNKGVENAADAVRKQLYQLKKGRGSYKIVDLGNLRNGIDLEDTYLRIKEVGELLISFKILPVFIGSSHDMDYGQYLSYEKFNKLTSVVNVDAYLDMKQELDAIPCDAHTNKILFHQPNYLFNFSNIGYQTYLNDQEKLDALEKLYFTNYRIGSLRDNFKEIEPVIREANMLTFDITAIRKNDAPGNNNALVFGFTAEEACQIAWYAGTNDQLNSLGIYEYNPSLDKESETAMVISTMLWYFIEGFYKRTNDLNFYGNNFIRYKVSIGDDNHNINFFKSIESERWWMEVHYKDEKSGKEKVTTVPCTYSDYLIALDGEIPDRWINTHAKLF